MARGFAARGTLQFETWNARSFQEQPFTVELKDSGLTLEVPDQTLLATLRAANIDVQSDCEEGLCGSCEVRVLAGEIDHRDVVLTRGEREANNRMMACCSRAAKGGRSCWGCKQARGLMRQPVAHQPASTTQRHSVRHHGCRASTPRIVSARSFARNFDT
jgi:ferredoxin